MAELNLLASETIYNGSQALLAEMLTNGSSFGFIDDILQYTNNSNHSTNVTDVFAPRELSKAHKLLYIIFTPIMILVCLISLVVNLKVLVSVYWIRRPMSPTLQISLSLAGADAFTSALLGINLSVFSLLPNVVTLPDMDCFALALEAFRLSGVICSILHLLALTGNHYLGILKPLHYASIMTHRNTKLILLCLWLAPNTFFFAYFSSVPDDGFQHNCTNSFLAYKKFRFVYATMFFIPLALMVGIYGHIFVIVRRHQATRSRYLKTGAQASVRNSGASCRYRNDKGMKKEEQNMNRNIKAIRTTLYILGSFFVGLMPNTIIYCLVCYDCYYDLSHINETILFYILVLFNTLCILKTLVNPIIYAARMQEIKNATIRMNNACYACVCCCLDEHFEHDGLSTGESHRLRNSSNAMSHSKLSVCSSIRRSRCAHSASTYAPVSASVMMSDINSPLSRCTSLKKTMYVTTMEGAHCPVNTCTQRDTLL